MECYDEHYNKFDIETYVKSRNKLFNDGFLCFRHVWNNSKDKEVIENMEKCKQIYLSKKREKM